MLLSPCVPPVKQGLVDSGLKTDRATALVVIDPTVPDYESLVQGCLPHARPLILTTATSILEQITAALQPYSGIRQIHLFCHGQPGGLLVGDTLIDRFSLMQVAPTLQQWGTSLQQAHPCHPHSALPPAIVLYGCEVAQGEKGEAFVTLLSQLTGVPVTATTSRTGHSKWGGNWELEWQSHPLAVHVDPDGSGDLHGSTRAI